MKLRIDLKKIKEGVVRVIKKMPEIIAPHAFLVFLFLLFLEIFLGLYLYQRFCFPRLPAQNPPLYFKKSELRRALKKIRNEESKDLSGREYFYLFRVEGGGEEVDEKVD